MYVVKDSLGNIMYKAFSYKEAFTFKYSHGNFRWSITAN